MGRFLKFLVVLVVLFTTANCKKDRVGVSIGKQNCKIINVKFSADSQNNYSEDLSYDRSGRPIKTKKRSVTCTIVYASDKITIADENGVKIELTLEEGKIIKAHYENSKHYETYTYNSEGYLSQIMHYYNPMEFDVIDITYKAGNIAEIVKEGSDESTTVFNYEYSTEPASSALFVASPLYGDLIDYFLPGLPFGKQSKNLNVKRTENYTDNDPINTSKSNIIGTFDYLKDANGNYTKIISTFEEIYSISSHITESSWMERYDLTYDCN